VKNSAEKAQDPATDELLLADSPEDDDSILEDEPAAGRQGLPPGFRMRHDRHYVDELMGVRVASASRAMPLVAEPAQAPAAPVSKDHSGGTDRHLRSALATVAERLDAIRAHAHAVRRSNASTFDRAMQLELDRAARLAHAAVVLSGEITLSRRESGAGEIAERAMRAIAPLRRFGGVRFESSVEDDRYRIAIDPAKSAFAIAGALEALASVADGAHEAEDDVPVVHLRVNGVQPRPALMVEIAVPGIALEGDALASFFEPSSAGHPAGSDGSLLLSAAARIARAHGGRADVKHGPDGELVALFVFPKAH
jgi:hypothetical protein